MQDYDKRETNIHSSLNSSKPPSKNAIADYFGSYSRDDSENSVDTASKVLIRNYLLFNLSKENMALKQFLNNLEKNILITALRLANGSQKNTSEILGVKPTSLSEKIKKFKIKNKVGKKVLNLEVLNIHERKFIP